MSFEPLIATSGDVRRTEVPVEIMRLAEKLSQNHGQVVISREASGCHLYMASPKVLETEGVRELEKRHLAVNADRYFGLGAWRQSLGTYDADRSAMCMKTETPYRVSELKEMRPIKERGYPDAVTGVQVRVKERYLVPDAKGVMVPESPGTVVPITSLPPTHPAAEYLLNRGYNLKRLDDQFNCGYCTEELPERHEEIDGIPKKFYPPLPSGWKDTPQGRIVFYCLMAGSAVAWQARIIDKVVNGSLHYFWHPYAYVWDLVEIRVGTKPDGKPIWKRVPPFDTQPPYTWKNPEWSPSKYKTAKDAERNQMIMGVDAAYAWNMAHRPRGRFICILCEGPLDAARFGMPALCLAGKFISDPQAKLIVSNFQEAIWVGDTDEAGRQGTLRVKAELGPKLKLHVVDLVGVKDAGELTDAQARALVAPFGIMD